MVAIYVAYLSQLKLVNNCSQQYGYGKDSNIKTKKRLEEFSTKGQGREDHVNFPLILTFIWKLKYTLILSQFQRGIAGAYLMTLNQTLPINIGSGWNGSSLIWQNLKHYIWLRLSMHIDFLVQSHKQKQDRAKNREMKFVSLKTQTKTRK